MTICCRRYRSVVACDTWKRSAATVTRAAALRVEHGQGDDVLDCRGEHRPKGCGPRLFPHRFATEKVDRSLNPAHPFYKRVYQPLTSTITSLRRRCAGKGTVAPRCCPRGGTGQHRAKSRRRRTPTSGVEQRRCKLPVYLRHYRMEKSVDPTRSARTHQVCSHGVRRARLRGHSGRSIGLRDAPIWESPARSDSSPA